MVVPLDDHGFHRGHAVFDTCNVERGRAYALEAHLDRLEASARRARLPLPAPRPELKRILLQLIAASGAPHSPPSPAAPVRAPKRAERSA